MSTEKISVEEVLRTLADQIDPREAFSAYQTFISEVNSNGTILYRHTERNMTWLYERAIEQGNGILLVTSEVWHKAFFGGPNEKGETLPDPIETPQEKARREVQRRVELEQRDRHDGSPSGNVPESEFERIRKQMRHIAQQQEQLEAQAQAQIDAAEQKQKAARDLSVVPTIQQFRDGVTLPQERLRKLAPPQLRLYLKNQAEAARLNAVAKSEAERNSNV
jgi:hypothetical protein